MIVEQPIRPPVFNKIGGFTKHNKYINILSKIAVSIEPVAQARIAACLVIKNEIISFGINKKKTHPFQAMYGTNENSIFLHAETDCIKNALKLVDMKQLTKASLYICRVKYEACTKNKFIFGLAKPCPGCSKAIATFGIKNIYYSLDNTGYAVL